MSPYRWCTLLNDGTRSGMNGVNQSEEGVVRELTVRSLPLCTAGIPASG